MANGTCMDATRSPAAETTEMSALPPLLQARSFRVAKSSSPTSQTDAADGAPPPGAGAAVHAVERRRNGARGLTTAAGGAVAVVSGRLPPSARVITSSAVRLRYPRRARTCTPGRFTRTEIERYFPSSLLLVDS